MTDRHTILYISDTHAGGEHGELEHLRSLVRRVVATYDPETTIISWLGDLTDDGAPEQVQAFAEVMDWLSERGFRQLATPGNHDASPDGWRGVRRSIRNRVIGHLVLRGHLDELKGEPPWVCVHEGVQHIIADTTAGMVPWDLVLDLARGGYGADQIAAIMGLVHDFDGPSIIHQHHHPTYRKHYVSDDNALIDVDTFKQAILDIAPETGDGEEAPEVVAAIVCGHNHRYELLTIPGVGVTVACDKATTLTDQGYSVVQMVIEDRVIQHTERVYL